MFMLSKVPYFGIRTVMLVRVAASVSSFFSAVLALFVSFWILFHVLLPDSPTFGSLTNSLIKVEAMLMGEFDFTTNFINPPNVPFLAKWFFVIFILLMALVFMNLLLGLAVSDIHELQRVSYVSAS
jgi:hypothetical protein